MPNPDTIKILKECDAGVKMGVLSIDEVLDNVSDEQLKALLTNNKDAHSQIGSEIHQILNDSGETAKEPNLSQTNSI